MSKTITRRTFLEWSAAFFLWLGLTGCSPDIVNNTKSISKSNLLLDEQIEDAAALIGQVQVAQWERALPAPNFIFGTETVGSLGNYSSQIALFSEPTPMSGMLVNVRDISTLKIVDASAGPYWNMTTVKDITKFNPSGGIWYKVETNAGTGWINSSLLIPNGKNASLEALVTKTGNTPYATGLFINIQPKAVLTITESMVKTANLGFGVPAFDDTGKIIGYLKADDTVTVMPRAPDLKGLPIKGKFLIEANISGKPVQVWVNNSHIGLDSGFDTHQYFRHDFSPDGYAGLGKGDLKARVDFFQGLVQNGKELPKNLNEIGVNNKLYYLSVEDNLKTGYRQFVWMEEAPVNAPVRGPIVYIGYSRGGDPVGMAPMGAAQLSGTGVPKELLDFVDSAVKNNGLKTMYRKYQPNYLGEIAAFTSNYLQYIKAAPIAGITTLILSGFKSPQLAVGKNNKCEAHISYVNGTSKSCMS